MKRAYRKISYVRIVYESVDNKSLPKVAFQKTTENRIRALKAIKLYWLSNCKNRHYLHFCCAIFVCIMGQIILICISLNNFHLKLLCELM